MKRKCPIQEDIEWHITDDSVRLRKPWNVHVQCRKIQSDTLLIIQLKRKCTLQEDKEWHITDDSVRLRKHSRYQRDNPREWRIIQWSTEKGEKKDKQWSGEKKTLYRNNIPSKDVSVYLVCSVYMYVLHRCQLKIEIF